MPKKRDKWSSTGWKYESNYIDKVLVGNWFEERQQFYRGGTTGSSLNRLDYKPRSAPRTETLTRKILALKNWEGIGRSCFVNGDEYKSNLITNHIVDYQVPLLTAPTPIRRWDKFKTAWVPEKLDRPIEEIQLPRLLKRNRYSSVLTNSPVENDNLSKKRDRNQCPPIQIPQALPYDHEPVVMKYRHRNTDVTPFFPVILRNTPKQDVVCKWSV